MNKNPSQSKSAKTPHEDFLVQFENTTLRIAGEDQFKNTSWTIRPGEQWAVLGSDDSGKSALLRAILGRESVSSGEITYGFDGTQSEPSLDFPDSAIGYASQEEHRALARSVLAFHQARWTSFGEGPALSARDVIFGENPDTTAKSFDTLLETLNVKHLLNRGLETLSNGEMRKVLIARELAKNPRLLILDAPYSGLDTTSRKNLKSLLSAFMRDGLTVVMTAQRPDELPSSITHAIFVEKNRVTAQGRKRYVAKEAKTLLQPSKPSTLDFPRIATAKWSGAAQPNSGPLVEIKNARVIYDGVSILKGVDWTIQPGEKWALRGPNGSGKSTLASLILGDNPQAYSNHVRVFGHLRGTGESLWEIKEHIGWISPELHYHYDLAATCREVVCSGLHDTIGVYSDGSVLEERQTRRWMRALQVARHANDFFGGLPEGAQRLVLMARALVKEPSLLILDEPCQGLDQEQREVMLALLDALGRQPAVAIIYITHHPDEIPKAFTHEISLKNGEVIRRGLRHIRN
jgi:molybdate transport system ATP-binding protein